MNGEIVNDIYGIMQVLLNKLRVIEQSFSKAHINLKLLDNMPKVWEPKTTTVIE